MFGDLVSLDFSDLAGYADFDWDALFAALGDLGAEDLGGLFIDTTTGQIVDAATAAMEEGLDPDLLGIAGDDMDFSDAGFVEEPPIYVEEAETGLGYATPEQVAATAPFNADPGFNWSKLLGAAGSGLSGLAKSLLGGGGAGDGLNLGSLGRNITTPSLGSVDTGYPQAWSGGGASVPSVSSPMAAAMSERGLAGGGGGLYGGDANTGGQPGTPSSYVRDPITGLPVPAPAQTPPGAQPLQLSPFTPLIIPSNAGPQIPMAMQPAPRMGGLQRLLMESRG